MSGHSHKRSNVTSQSRPNIKSSKQVKRLKAGYEQPHRVKRHQVKDSSKLRKLLKQLPDRGNCMLELELDTGIDDFKNLLKRYFQAMKIRKQPIGLKFNCKDQVGMDTALRVLKDHVEECKSAVVFDWEKVWLHSFISKNRKIDILQVLREYPGVTVSLAWRKGTIRKSADFLNEMAHIVNEFEEHKAEHHLNFEIAVKMVFTEYGQLYDFLKEHPIATLTITRDKSDKQLTMSEHNWLINHMYRESIFWNVGQKKREEPQLTELHRWIKGLEIEPQWRGQIVCGSSVISTAEWLPVCLRTRSECTIMNGMWSQRIGHRIGLCNGWLMSKWEYPPPYVLSGRFYKRGQVDFTIYVRSTGIAYPPDSTNTPHSGLACSMGESSFQIGTHNLMDNVQAATCPLGHSAGYNFRIIDKGVGLPLVFEVERTGEDGIGDSHPRKLKLQAGLHTDSLYWHNYIVLAANSDKKDGFVMIDHLSVLYDKNPREREDMRRIMKKETRQSNKKKYSDMSQLGVEMKRGKQYKNL